MADTHNEAEVKTRYPVDDGITARTTTQEGHVMQLEAQEGSIVEEKEKVGF